jgi:5-methylcytosine-specific restriction endonuclease McrA
MKKIAFEYEYLEKQEDVRKHIQECGERGGRLEADHIKPVSKFPELIFELTNGRTLCRDCHFKTITYGRPKKLSYA